MKPTNLDYKRASEKMRKKTFGESFKTPLMVVKGMFIVFAVLSAFTGFNAFFEVIRYALPFVLAVAFAVLFLCIVEVGESFAMDNAFENYYTRKAASPTLSAMPHFLRTVAAVFLGLLSVGLSVFGTYYGSKNLADVEGKTMGVYAVRLDSIGQSFDIQIAAMDSTKAAYFAQNSWRNKLKNNQATEQFNAYEQEAASLRKDKQAAISQARKAEAKDLMEGNTKADFNAYAMASWVLLLSLGKLFKHWFENYYSYRLDQEIEKTDTYIEESPQITVTENEPKRVAAGFAYAAQKTANTANTAVYAHKCTNCGSQKGMQNKRKDAKYCSPTCKAEHHNHKK